MFASCFERSSGGHQEGTRKFFYVFRKVVFRCSGSSQKILSGGVQEIFKIYSNGVQGLFRRSVSCFFQVLTTRAKCFQQVFGRFSRRFQKVAIECSDGVKKRCSGCIPEGFRKFSEDFLKKYSKGCQNFVKDVQKVFK